ncbi:universal stress protein [Dokdonella koreensis]|uniref:Universal stress protein n=1 Tax=Dokdonella koreensis DS-123 TaxID=1300342 RepID=A0A160DUI4_9GAMM|nr:universal stress protein [Dokdonella koreensis]ANB17730.1 Universal stress protein [Dokdonella koreensis DS-123]
MFKKILVPTDGSALSHKAIAGAVELATALGAGLVGYCGAEAYALSFAEYTLVDPEQFRAQALAGAQRHANAVARAAAAAGVPCETAAAPCDTVWSGIIEAATAHGCDLILMASHGRRGLSAALLGSETQKVLTHSTIPVLVYR